MVSPLPGTVWVHVSEAVPSSLLRSGPAATNTSGHPPPLKAAKAAALSRVVHGCGSPGGGQSRSVRLPLTLSSIATWPELRLYSQPHETFAVPPRAWVAVAPSGQAEWRRG